MKAIQKIKQILKSLSEGATSRVLFGHGVPAARRRWGRGSFCLVVTPTDSSKHSTSGSNISDSNNARRITNLVFRGLSGAYERGGRSASPVTTGASDSVSEKHLNGDSSFANHFVLRHGLFLSLYSLIKKASGKLPWRSRTNSLNTTRNYIKNFRRIRILGSASLFSLGLLLLATFVPLYNVTRTEDTEAAAGTAKDSSITFTSTRSTASVDLTVTSENGTFASSTSSNQAAFSLSTTNYTGYTLTIASNTDTSTLSNGNGGTLSSISEPIDESTFNTTAYNNKWGYKPNYYNSAANSNYLQSPTTTASTLDETSSANSTAKNYTIALGARADYTNASGTYSSSNYKLMYVANPVAYSISFDKGSAAETPSNMPAVVTGSVSALSVNLPNTVPTRTAYDFIGWCLGTITTTNNVDTCSNANVYNPNGNGTNLAFGIDRESSNDGVTLHAMWKIKTFICSAQYRLQNADGTFPDTYTSDTANDSTTTYGGSCSYTTSITDYKGSESSSNDASGTVSVSNVTENKTLSLDFYRNTYALTVTASTNTSSATGSGTYRWGQTVTVGVTKASNVTCTTYATPTWTQSGTTGTFSSTSGTSVNFTMGKGNATITAKSTASNKSQTVTLSKGTGVSSIKIGSTNYTASSVSLYCGSYSISGNYDSNYEFSSWSRSGSVTVSSTSNASTTMTVNGAGTLTLNAKQSKLYMQNMTSSDCTTTAKTVYDNRDENAYLVQKLSDGNCWMLDNLRLGGTSDISLTTANTNSKGDFTLPAGITSGFNSYTAAQINVASKDTVASIKHGNGSGKIGVYYNYCAASAGTICSDSNSSNASYDICPKGWRMPTGGSSGEYKALYAAYSSNDTNFRNALSTPLSGYFYISSADKQGSYGYFWSSTYRTSDFTYYLLVDSSSVHPEYDGNRIAGMSIRCVMKPTMQDVTASSLATLMPNTGDTTTLVDSRDGKEYSVAKLADGKYWMTSNLDLTGGITLTSSDSNVSSDYDLPASSSSPDFNSSTTATRVYNSGSTNCSASMGCYSYYSHLAATAGTDSSVSTTGYNASGSICPKGWRLPTATTSNAQATTNNNWKTGDFYALATAYGANLESNYYHTSGTIYTNAGPGTTPNFLLSGHFNSHFFTYGGSQGYYWSSTAASSTNAYILSLSSSGVNSAYSINRVIGVAVRCVYAG